MGFRELSILWEKIAAIAVAECNPRTPQQILSKPHNLRLAQQTH